MHLRPDQTGAPPTIVAHQVNAAPEADLRAFLTACCDVPSWVGAVVAGRPYADDAVLLETADGAARRFDADEVDRALAAHPRIGEKVAGDSQEARWSRGEQSSASAGGPTATALTEVNRAYEQRFGRVFLICASGLSAEQILAAGYDRLDNTEDAELAVVADELRKIALLRLQKGPIA
ncbi:MAG: 2-oxo-4-hydroxy-4-carboxy-5-ureidoimidazoline decarboxylase [Nocardioidaceae bacterium]